MSPRGFDTRGGQAEFASLLGAFGGERGVAHAGRSLGIDIRRLYAACGILSFATGLKQLQRFGGIARSSLPHQVANAQTAAAAPPLEIAGPGEKAKRGIVITWDAVAPAI